LTSQAAERSNWPFAPRLVQGQELVYRGTFSEEALGKGVQFNRSYRLENRVLVLDTSPRGLDVAFYTTLKLRAARPERSEEPAPSSVRLEVARVGPRGKITADPGTSLVVPLEGPATVECGLFVEVPRGRLSLKDAWETAEDGRPPRLWKVLGTQVLNNTTCVKIEGLQQSQEWEQLRADRTVWRRRDTVWLAPSLGVAYKLERVLERREAGHREPTERSVVQYELQTNISYPGQLFEGLRCEVLQARRFAEDLAPYLPNPAKYGPRPFDAMLVKIDHHLEKTPNTPYRDAVLQVKRRVEAARRGESPPSSSFEEAVAGRAAVGQRAPDFVATNLITSESVSLRRLLGRPVVLVFYTPNSTKAEEVLRFAQNLQDTNAGAVTVIGLAVSDDADRIRTQHKGLSLSLPVVAAKGLRQSYQIEATPKLVVLDSKGIVRGSFVGWGPETPASVNDELKLWLAKK
jgi:peroxiredoxin